MSKPNLHTIESTILGIVTTTTLGSWIFQAFSVLLLAMIGALGGWIFGAFIKPALDKLKSKYFKGKA